MKEEYRLLHDDMIEQINKTATIHANEVVHFMEEFNIALNTWEVLKGMVKRTGFINEEEEIDFFKHVKPLFTSRIEYAVMMYDAYSSMPKGRAQIQMFWWMELGRFDYFVKKHHDFVQYYESGRTDEDEVYFLRKSKQKKLISTIAYNDDDFFSVHDRLLRSYFARRKFRDYVKEQCRIHELSRA